WLLRFTDRIFLFATSENWFIKLFRNYIALNLAGLAFKNKLLKPFAFKTLSQTGYSYKNSSLSASFSRQRLRFKPGDRLPYFFEENIYPFFLGPSFHLLHIGMAPLTEPEKEK